MPHSSLPTTTISNMTEAARLDDEKLGIDEGKDGVGDVDILAADDLDNTRQGTTL